MCTGTNKSEDNTRKSQAANSEELVGRFFNRVKIKEYYNILETKISLVSLLFSNIQNSSRVFAFHNVVNLVVKW